MGSWYTRKKIGSTNYTTRGCKGTTTSTSSKSKNLNITTTRRPDGSVKRTTTQRAAGMTKKTVKTIVKKRK